MSGNAKGIRAGKAFVEIFADDSRLMRGLKAARQKLSAFGARGFPLNAVTLDYGRDGDFPWVRRGVEFAGGLMRARGIPVTVAIHAGDHESRLGERLETAMLPAMTTALAKGLP